MRELARKPNASATPTYSPSLMPPRRVADIENEHIPHGQLRTDGFARDFTSVPTHGGRPIRVQPKLKVGATNDPAEYEADRIADEVMRMPVPIMRRMCACPGTCGCEGTADAGESIRGEPGVRLKPAGRFRPTGIEAPPIVHEVLDTPGQPLDTEIRGFFEPRFGHHFGHVRVHTGAKAEAASDAIGAKAFTAGSHIVFGANEYVPNLQASRSLIAHELAHVTQQLAAPPSTLHRKAYSTPRRLACDFVPDDVFYEFLAHVFAYQDNTDGAFLYKACPPASGAAPDLPSVLPGFKGPSNAGDDFAFMRDKPDMPKPIPYVGGANPPLVYEVTMMKPDDEKSGLYVSKLRPLDNARVPTIILFRGTEPTAADIAADADAGGVGFTAFQNNRAAIAKLVKSGAGKVVVVGHSLGGALAQWTAADSECTSSVAAVITFNAPGISRKAAAKFKEASAKEKNAPEVHHFGTRGDLVSIAGQAKLPGTTTTMEGRATRELQNMLDAGYVELIQKSLLKFYGLIAYIVNDGVGPLDRWIPILKTLSDLLESGAIAACMRFGTLLGDLHSQRLLRVSKIPPPQKYQFLAPQRPLSPDVADLAQSSGKVKVKTEQQLDASPGSQRAAKIEMARASLGAGFSKDIYSMFDDLKPYIALIQKNTRAAIAAETSPGLSKVSPVRHVAKAILPLLEKLLPALSSAGGLEFIVEAALKQGQHDVARQVGNLRPVAPVDKTGTSQNAKQKAEYFLAH